MTEETVRSEGERSVAIGGNAQGNIILTGDILIQTITQGIRTLPTNYATKIENFIHAYLGTPQEPVPFGGRDAALRSLNTWLEDPNAPPRLLLTAPAGRGKSALLVRWLAALEQETLEKVFVPISIRYETNLASVTLASLAARLAIAHGEKVSSDTNTPDEIWKGLAADYLRRPLPDGRRLLVVLDGLDEAANWDVTPALFPHDLPPGLRLVVSARLTADRPTAEAWLRALGWERLPTYRLSLEALDKPGVADVLQKMGVPLDQLARNIDLVAELHRLSEATLCW